MVWEVVFWSAMVLVAYCYLGYPLLLLAWARLRPRPVRKASVEPATPLAGPRVSIVMSCFNEEANIERRVRNLLALDYPRELVTILVGSDGSTDRTSEILGRFDDPRLRAHLFQERRGKIAVLNDLVSRVEDEIVVFADARQTFAPDAVRQLVANFADPEVGCVSGELVLGPPPEERDGKGGGDGMTARGIGLYWRYEKLLRVCESAVGSTVGATGAIYALRRRLFSPVPAQVVLDDMYTPLGAVMAGQRLVLDQAAKAYDVVATNPAEEHKRKARTLFGNYQLFALRPGLLDPRRSPVAIQLFSHKLLRLWAPFLLAFALVANLSLLGRPLYDALFAGQVAFYGLAAIGSLARRREGAAWRRLARLCYVPYVFCVLNTSALAGFWRFVRGSQSVTWEKASLRGHRAPSRDAAADADDAVEESPRSSLSA